MISLSQAEEDRAMALHERAVIIDAHSDIPFSDVIFHRRLGRTHVMEARHLPTMREGNVAGIVGVVGGDYGHFTESHARLALETMDCMYLEASEQPRQILIAKCAQDFLMAKDQGRLAIMFGFEGGKPLEGSIGALRMFHRLGLRVFGICHDIKNEMACGVGASEKTGLTNFGMEVVEEANRLGVAIDLSHLTEAGFMDVLECSKVPVIASHGNPRTMGEHTRYTDRNFTDEQIKALAENGGVLGVGFIGSLLGKFNSTIDVLLKHIDYAVRIAGINHVGLGPDYMYYFDPKDTGWTQEQLNLRNTRGIEDYSKMTNVTRGLVSMGYSDEEILKILGRNFLEVFKKIIGQ